MEEAADQAADDGYHTGRLGGPGDEELSGALAQGKVQPRGPETHGPTKNNQHVLLDPLFAPPYNVACTAPGVVQRLGLARFSLPGATSPDRQYLVSEDNRAASSRRRT